MFTRVSVESKLELTRVRWRVVVVLLRRERVIRFGGWCAQTIRERFFIDHSKRKDISRAEKNERRKLFIREREREDLARAAIKNFFAAIVVVPKLFVLFSFFSSSPAFSTGCLLYRQKEWKVWFELCFETASLKERQLHSNISNYGQKNEIGEKSREIGTTKQRASRAWRWDALSPFAALLFCALKRVYIYIYLIYKSRFPQFKGVSFPQFSRSRGD